MDLPQNSTYKASNAAPTDTALGLKIPSSIPAAAQAKLREMALRSASIVKPVAPAAGTNISSPPSILPWQKNTAGNVVREAGVSALETELSKLPTGQLEVGQQIKTAEPHVPQPIPQDYSGFRLQTLAPGSPAVYPKSPVIMPVSATVGGGQYVKDTANPDALVQSVRGDNIAIKKALLNGRPSWAYQVDHIIPLHLGGADTIDNYQVYTNTEHAIKTKVQAVAYSLYLNGYWKNPDGSLNKNPAMVMSMNWKSFNPDLVPDPDFSGKYGPANTGLIDYKEAKKIAELWQSPDKHVSVKDWFASIPDETRAIAKALPGPLGAAYQGLVSSATMGFIPNTFVSEGASFSEKTANTLGSVAGMLTSYGAAEKMLFKPTLKYLGKGLSALGATSVGGKLVKAGVAANRGVGNVIAENPLFQEAKLVASEIAGYVPKTSLATSALVTPFRGPLKMLTLGPLGKARMLEAAYGMALYNIASQQISSKFSTDILAGEREAAATPAFDVAKTAFEGVLNGTVFGALTHNLAGSLATGSLIAGMDWLADPSDPGQAVVSGITFGILHHNGIAQAREYEASQYKTIKTVMDNAVIGKVKDADPSLKIENKGEDFTVEEWKTALEAIPTARQNTENSYRTGLPIYSVEPKKRIKKGTEVLSTIAPKNPQELSDRLDRLSFAENYIKDQIAAMETGSEAPHPWSMSKEKLKAGVGEEIDLINLSNRGLLDPTYRKMLSDIKYLTDLNQYSKTYKWYQDPSKTGSDIDSIGKVMQSLSRFFKAPINDTNSELSKINANELNPERFNKDFLVANQNTSGKGVIWNGEVTGGGPEAEMIKNGYNQYINLLKKGLVSPWYLVKTVPGEGGEGRALVYYQEMAKGEPTGKLVQLGMVGTREQLDKVNKKAVDKNGNKRKEADGTERDVYGMASEPLVDILDSAKMESAFVFVDPGRIRQKADGSVAHIPFDFNINSLKLGDIFEKKYKEFKTTGTTEGSTLAEKMNALTTETDPAIREQKTQEIVVEMQGKGGAYLFTPTKPGIQIRPFEKDGVAKNVLTWVLDAGNKILSIQNKKLFVSAFRELTGAKRLSAERMKEMYENRETYSVDQFLAAVEETGGVAAKIMENAAVRRYIKDTAAANGNANAKVYKDLFLKLRVLGAKKDPSVEPAIEEAINKQTEVIPEEGKIDIEQPAAVVPTTAAERKVQVVQDNLLREKLENPAEKEKAFEELARRYLVANKQEPTPENIGEIVSGLKQVPKAMGLDDSTWIMQYGKELLRAGEGDLSMPQLGYKYVKKGKERVLTPYLKSQLILGKDGEVFINLLKKADVSSFLHEVSHIARNKLFDLSIKEKERAGITNEDIVFAEDVFGAVSVKDGKRVVDWKMVGKDGITAEERWANSFERYFYEGKAPKGRTEEETKGLRGLFEKVSRWMKNVYEKIIKDTPLSKEISPEIRKVFDNLMTRGDRLKELQIVGSPKPTPTPQEGKKAPKVVYVPEKMSGAELEKLIEEHREAVQSGREVVAAAPKIDKKVPPYHTPGEEVAGIYIKRKTGEVESPEERAKKTEKKIKAGKRKEQIAETSDGIIIGGRKSPIQKVHNFKQRLEKVGGFNINPTTMEAGKTYGVFTDAKTQNRLPLKDNKEVLDLLRRGVEAGSLFRTVHSDTIRLEKTFDKGEGDKEVGLFLKNNGYEETVDPQNREIAIWKPTKDKLTEIADNNNQKSIGQEETVATAVSEGISSTKDAEEASNPDARREEVIKTPEPGDDVIQSGLEVTPTEAEKKTFPVLTGKEVPSWHEAAKLLEGARTEAEKVYAEEYLRQETNRFKNDLGADFVGPGKDNSWVLSVLGAGHARGKYSKEQIRELFKEANKDPQTNEPREYSPEIAPVGVYRFKELMRQKVLNDTPEEIRHLVSQHIFDNPKSQWEKKMTHLYQQLTKVAGEGYILDADNVGDIMEVRLGKTPENNIRPIENTLNNNAIALGIFDKNNPGARLVVRDIGAGVIDVARREKAPNEDVIDFLQKKFWKNGQSIILGRTSKGEDQIVSMNFDKRLVDHFNKSYNNPATRDQAIKRYLNPEENFNDKAKFPDETYTDKFKFVRVLAVDLLGWPKDASVYDFTSKFNLIADRYSDFIPDIKDIPSEMIVTGADGSKKLKDIQITFLNSHDLKDWYKTTTGAKDEASLRSILRKQYEGHDKGDKEIDALVDRAVETHLAQKKHEGVIYVGEKLGKYLIKWQHLASERAKEQIKPIISHMFKIPEGQLRQLLLKGHITIISDAQIKDLKSEYKGKISPETFDNKWGLFAFDTSIKSGKDLIRQDGDVLNVPLTSFRYKNVGLGEDGRLTLTQLRKLADSDAPGGNAGDLLRERTQAGLKYLYALTRELKESATSQEFKDVLSRYDLKLEDIFRPEQIKWLNENGYAGPQFNEAVDNFAKGFIRKNILTLTKKNTQMLYLVSGTAMGKFDGKNAPERHIAMDEIILGKSQMKTLGLDAGDQVMISRDPSLFANNTAVLKVVDGDAAGHNTMGREQAAVHPFVERVILQGDLDGDKIRISKIRKGEYKPTEKPGKVPFFADQYDVEPWIANLATFQPKDGGPRRNHLALPVPEVAQAPKTVRITPAGILDALKMQDRGDQLTSKISTAIRIAQDVSALNSKIAISSTGRTKDGQFMYNVSFYTQKGGSEAVKLSAPRKLLLSAPLPMKQGEPVILTSAIDSKNRTILANISQGGVDSKKSYEFEAMTGGDKKKGIAGDLDIGWRLLFKEEGSKDILGSLSLEDKKSLSQALKGVTNILQPLYQMDTMMQDRANKNVEDLFISIGKRDEGGEVIQEKNETRKLATLLSNLEKAGHNLTPLQKLFIDISRYEEYLPGDIKRQGRQWSEVNADITKKVLVPAFFGARETVQEAIPLEQVLYLTGEKTYPASQLPSLFEQAKEKGLTSAETIDQYKPNEKIKEFVNFTKEKKAKFYEEKDRQSQSTNAEWKARYKTKEENPDLGWETIKKSVLLKKNNPKVVREEVLNKFTELLPELTQEEARILSGWAILSDWANYGHSPSRVTVKETKEGEYFPTVVEQTYSSVQPSSYKIPKYIRLFDDIINVDPKLSVLFNSEYAKIATGKGGKPAEVIIGEEPTPGGTPEFNAPQPEEASLSLPETASITVPDMKKAKEDAAAKAFEEEKQAAFKEDEEKNTQMEIKREPKETLDEVEKKALRILEAKLSGERGVPGDLFISNAMLKVASAEVKARVKEMLEERSGRTGLNLDAQGGPGWKNLRKTLNP